MGDKSMGVEEIVPLVASGDFAAVTINYRLSSEAVLAAQIHDCKAAIRWIQANTPNVPPQRGSHRRDRCISGRTSGGDAGHQRRCGDAGGRRGPLPGCPTAECSAWWTSSARLTFWRWVAATMMNTRQKQS